MRHILAPVAAQVAAARVVVQSHPDIKMKPIIIYLTLVTVPWLFVSLPPQQYLAMDSKGSVVQPEDNRKKEKKPETDHEDKGTGKDLSPENNDAQKKEKTPPEKKPRIKFRDESGCPC